MAKSDHGGTAKVPSHIKLSLGGLAQVIDRVREDQRMDSAQEAVMWLVREALRAKGYLANLNAPVQSQLVMPPAPANGGVRRTGS